MLAAGAALTLRPTGRERLVHDPPDGTGAPPALRAATETAVDLAGGARALGRVHRRAHVVVGEHVTGAHNHGLARQPALVRYATNCFSPTLVRAGRQKKKAQLTRIPMLPCGALGTGPKRGRFARCGNTLMAATGELQPQAAACSPDGAKRNPGLLCSALETQIALRSIRAACYLLSMTSDTFHI